MIGIRFQQIKMMLLNDDQNYRSKNIELHC
jgi:hypothetical protein